MKNVLIPTNLQQDTLQALKVSISEANGQDCNITLLFLREVSDTASAAFWLRKMNTEFTAAQEDILEKCHEIVSFHDNCTLKFQQQYSVSKPLLKNFIDCKSINWIIVPESFRKSEVEMERYCLKLLSNCEQPILQLSTDFEEHQFSKALYIENGQSALQAKDLAALIGSEFSFSIVSQTKIIDDQNHEEMTPILYDAIYKNGIDLLIETRKPAKIRLTKKNKPSFHENLGLPVLSVYEPAY